MANMEHSKKNKKEHRKGPASPGGEASAKRSSDRGKKAGAGGQKEATGPGRKGPAKRSSDRGKRAVEGQKRDTSTPGGRRRPAGAADPRKDATPGVRRKPAGAGRDGGKFRGKPSVKSAKNDPSEKEKSTPGTRKKEEIRLNKYIAHAGICSRREADQLIAAGLISVNGQVITEVGTKVDPADDVRYNGERLGNERKVYLLLNKPKDYVTTVDDPHAKKTVMELVDRACKERIYPVGRLDRNTTGVLLFTNDGELTRKLTHPSFNKKKVYHVFLDKNLQHSDLNKIAEGIELEDGLIQPDAIAYASQDNKREIGLEIHSGKNRIVRRIFEQLGYKVTKLDRVYFAGLTKKNLSRGRWRFLTEKEIKMLKMNAFE
jgi:23S rRNA pseudouridine2605 synthase